MDTETLHSEMDGTKTVHEGADAYTGTIDNVLAHTTTNTMGSEISVSGLKETIACIIALHSNAKEGVLIENERREIVFANDVFCSLFNIKELPAAIIGTNYLGLLTKEATAVQDPVAYAAVIKEITMGRMPAADNKLALTDGREVSFDYTPIIYNKEFCGGIWKYTDISATKNAAQQAEKLKVYERILNNIPGDIAAFDRNHKYLFANPVAVKNPEMREWLIGRDDEEYCRYTNKPYDIAAIRNKKFDQVRVTRKMTQWEEKLPGKAGNIEHHLRNLYPIFDNEGNVEMVVGYSLNITRNKEIEDQVQISQRRYKEILNYSQAWICTHKLTGEILTMNPAACRIIGYEEHEVVGKDIADLLNSSMENVTNNDYLQKIIDEGVTEGIMTLFNKNGDEIHLLYQNYLLNEGSNEPYIIGFAQNITDRLYAEAALKRSEERYRKIIENMNLGMLEINTDEQIIYANQQFCNMSGYSMEELQNQKATDLFLENPKSRMINEKTWKRQYGISNKYEFRVKTKSGDSRWWLVSTAPLHNPDHTLKGSVSIHLDISRQKKMEKDLREAMIHAENSSQAKEAFLANMSHEIRTPINAIMGMGKLLSKSNLTDQQQFYLSSIRTASENLLVVINDILDISKIEAGQISLENIPFDIEELSKHAIAMLYPRAEEKGLEITSEVDPNISHSLLGDPYRINQVFINMISNAIKFTEAGHIHFSASLLEQVENKQKIAIIIEDTGVGINEDFLSIIFNKFTQEDETIVRNYGGTGLGMSITKQLMELMGGTIDISSRKNEGTSIKLTFTFKIGSQKIFEKKRAVRNDVSNIGNKKVLLVEDNELNKMLAYTILTQYGALVTTAENGIQALECVKKEKYDIILMDVQMPKMDGVQATRLIRKIHGNDIPIIALTANALKGKREEYIKSGMNDYIAKPYNEEKMITVISNWLHKVQKINQPPVGFAEEEEEIFIVNQDAPLFDIKNLMIQYGDNADFILQMLSVFINDVPQTMVKIRDAYHDSDFKTLKYLAHRIRPSLSNLCIHSIKDESFEIEQLAEIGEKSPRFEKMIEKMVTVINLVNAKMKAEYNI